MILDNQGVRQGRQICFVIGIRDDNLVESAETAVICGCSPHNVTFNGCVTLTIQDNDSKVLYILALNNKILVQFIHTGALGEELENIAAHVCLYNI